MDQMYNRFAGRTFKRRAIDRTTTKISSVHAWNIISTEVLRTYLNK